jgi:hypothetical protein
VVFLATENIEHHLPTRPVTWTHENMNEHEVLRCSSHPGMVLIGYQIYCSASDQTITIFAVNVVDCS